MLQGLAGKLPPELLQFLMKSGSAAKQGGQYAGQMAKSGAGKLGELAGEFPAGAAAIGGVGLGAAANEMGQEDELSEEEFMEMLMRRQGR